MIGDIPRRVDIYENGRKEGVQPLSKEEKKEWQFDSRFQKTSMEIANRAGRETESVFQD